MVYILSKILIFLIKPIVWLFALLVWSLFTKNKRKQRRLLIYAAVFLFVCSNSFLVGKLFNFYEMHYPKPQKYGVGILLGGFAFENKRNHSIAFGPANDRLMQAIKLLKNGTVQKLLISGGNAYLIGSQVKEADLTRDYLRTLRIPDSLVLIENQSRNTIENASFSKRMLDRLRFKGNVLVISSAWHLPRVRMLFAKQFGQRASYYPTQYLGKDRYTFDDFVIPDPEAFLNLHLLIKEWVGLGIDRFRA